jgi:hypothetical protein
MEKMKLVRKSSHRFCPKVLAETTEQESKGFTWRWSGKIPGDERTYHLDVHSDKHLFTLTMNPQEAEEFRRFVEEISTRDAELEAAAFELGIPV